MPSVQRRVLTNGKIRYRALVRLKGYKPKTATFIKRVDDLPDISGHKESDEYNHFWRCSVWEENAISIRKSIKLKRFV